MNALLSAQINGEFFFDRRIERLVEIVLEKDIFGRNGRIGFKLEYPMTVGALARQQGLRRRRDRTIEGRPVDRRRCRVRLGMLLHVL